MSNRCCDKSWSTHVRLGKWIPCRANPVAFVGEGEERKGYCAVHAKKQGIAYTPKNAKELYKVTVRWQESNETPGEYPLAGQESQGYFRAKNEKGARMAATRNYRLSFEKFEIVSVILLPSV